MNAYELAKAEIGVTEWKKGDNPKIVAYFKDAGHPQVKDDETAWCAAFVGAMLKRSGAKGTGKLSARSYLDWGAPVKREDAKEGDIVIFSRGSSSWEGHVAFFVKDNGKTITVLGANQSNAVNRRSYDADRLLGIRRMVPAEKPVRTSPVQSTTIQASAVQVSTAVGGGVAAVGALDGKAQLVALVLAGVIIMAALWIMRERLRKWASGVR